MLAASNHSRYDLSIVFVFFAPLDLLSRAATAGVDIKWQLQQEHSWLFIYHGYPQKGTERFGSC